LRGLDLKGLRARWQSVLQRPAPGHLPRHLLFAIIAYRIQADRFGDLDHETRQLLDRTCVYQKPYPCFDDVTESLKTGGMIGLLCFVLAALASPFKSKIRLEAENAALRHQLIVLRRKLRGRVKLANSDRWFFIQLYRWFPSILKVLTVIRPETLVRWHRAGFRSYWRWKSRSLGGRPQIDSDLRALIRRMSVENSLWGAPRIHGELLKLGFEVAQSSVAKYMVKRRGAPCQGWRTFLRNQAPDIAAMDLFVVPTIGFKLLYGFVIIRLDRRDLVWINVTTNPTAEWVARQITEAFPWDGAPGYMIRDRDRIYGAVVTRRLRAMGIRDKPIAPSSPWQNGFAERLMGSIRRECLDHIIVLGEEHLRRILKNYAAYYNGVRTHRSLNKDAPVSRPVQRSGIISSHAILGGLHHQYVRI
jgi:transposase InsO family protein